MLKITDTLRTQMKLQDLSEQTAQILSNLIRIEETELDLEALYHTTKTIVSNLDAIEDADQEDREYLQNQTSQILRNLTDLDQKYNTHGLSELEKQLDRIIAKLLVVEELEGPLKPQS